VQAILLIGGWAVLEFRYFLFGRAVYETSSNLLMLDYLPIPFEL